MPTFSPQSPTEYFRELVESAMAKQKVAASELTSFYVVNLLTGFVRMRETQDDALGPRLYYSLHGEGAHHRHELRFVGDMSLFVTGFFSESLERSLVSPEYYVQLGETAYGQLAGSADPTLGDVFQELAERFVSFVDVISEVRDLSSDRTDQSVLRLYDLWIRTGSKRAAKRLEARGVTVNRSVRSSFLQ
ncbi:MAG: hypothetical protein A3I07_03585 [Candidatus Doudnabacteria bacterium RIFCSPLOWO2_02_FULL_42_9]|uniref:Uncharacterized protein n=1 Tax=Candidatus Doudnabacteria bacterium RIFCSPHIGHO2_01_FULL_41_86 TaxID=1817821 RepID=A0A1F5N9N5_9BACT|nr:MAG: hypothetical protein A2717_02445 [Candidatus Doudnabacteria bacterium RIFCSPHIGHO2_01_FULL_41_86]OGE75621.1 MAG: hypothetical protein A3K07_02205 [Candidatus Doudnabacteria bacterium RIFCSPHIGHO2_01_43_10]OGE85416.1 MAG: hypothetical protein A3E28_02015 [Candidatus Doudnabacteria bacterium RIFCSPHIGHO2_12_FULL_42_22]OGE86954.1 MAG: hypothetical protein A3C49_02850 [Candidatus Doudnabacteria bacterium RIFCSPHIGHO2_02_FULL_42_25]OGE92553.1 MAG: hypothetical protein A2895_03005 [Candidatus